MIEAPLVLAFTAGLVATVNPCGIAMLPAYLSYFVGLGEDGSETVGQAATVRRALTVGAVVSAGFLTVFGIAGVLITLGLRQIIGAIPWAALVVGVAVGLLGVAMLFGYQLTLNLPKVGGGTSGRRYSGVFVFGVSYAVASLSCTLPIFLAVVAGVIPSLSLAAGIATFMVYGLGMSLVLVVLTLALAFGQKSLVGRIRASARYVNRVAGGILVLAGGYIVFFWATNLRQGPLETGSAVQFVEQISSRLSNVIGNAPLLWGLLLGGSVAVAVGYALWSSRRGAEVTAARRS